MSIEGDVYNQGNKVITTDAKNFTLSINPQSYSAPFKVTAPFTRVIYKDDEGYGCVFEFSVPSSILPPEVRYYGTVGGSSCDVVIAGSHTTLIVGSH
jgi:hypothetical protein